MDATASNDGLRVLPCQLGSEVFCLDAERVQTIEDSGALQRNPGPGEPYGWLLSRADEIEVYYLADRFGEPRRPPSSDDAPAVLVVDAEPTPFGLAVDQVLDERRVDTEELLPLPVWVQNQRARFFSGAVRAGDALWLYLAPERLHPQALPCEPEPVWAPERSAALQGSPEPGKLLFFTADREPAGGSVTYALSVRQVLEVHEMPPIRRVPTSPAGLRGLVHYRGEAVPVVDLHQLLGLEASEGTNDAQLLVVRGTTDERPVGLAIRRGVRVVDLPIACREVEAEGRLAGLVRGVFEMEKSTLIVPDVDAIPSSIQGLV